LFLVSNENGQSAQKFLLAFRKSGLAARMAMRFLTFPLRARPAKAPPRAKAGRCRPPSPVVSVMKGVPVKTGTQGERLPAVVRFRRFRRHGEQKASVLLTALLDRSKKWRISAIGAIFA
jgi:hypothetical protein